MVLVPSGPLTVRLTGVVAGVLYVCDSERRVVFVTAPSPNDQKQLLIVPLERSVNDTLSGQSSLVGLAVKLAVGGTAAEPVRTLVALPPFPVMNIALFVKA